MPTPRAIEFSDGDKSTGPPHMYPGMHPWPKGADWPDSSSRHRDLIQAGLSPPRPPSSLSRASVAPPSQPLSSPPPA
eukprot:4499293-Pyramimonas_sp.AAC.1